MSRPDRDAELGGRHDEDPRSAGLASPRRVFFVVFDHCEILDLAGPLQAISESTSFGARYETGYVGPSRTAVSAQGLEIGGISPLPDVRLGDWIFVPGYPLRTPPPGELHSWLAEASPAGAMIHSICTGAFALAEAGLLDGRRCTTHWRRIPELRQSFPRAKVLDDRLWVEDSPVITSAGIASGIDMTLWLLENDAGREVASAVAREMVVYFRRGRQAKQRSVYFDYQDHMSSGVHRVQEHLINNPSSNQSLSELGEIALMSSRHLTRSFRQVTGLTVGEFRTRLRLEHARNLLESTNRSIESIAMDCGFSDARQLHRLWIRRFGSPPSEHRVSRGSSN